MSPQLVQGLEWAAVWVRVQVLALAQVQVQALVRVQEQVQVRVQVQVLAQVQEQAVVQVWAQVQVQVWVWVPVWVWGWVQAQVRVWVQVRVRGRALERAWAEVWVRERVRAARGCCRGIGRTFASLHAQVGASCNQEGLWRGTHHFLRVSMLVAATMICTEVALSCTSSWI